MHIIVPLFVPCGLVVQAIPPQYIIGYGKSTDHKKEKIYNLNNDCKTTELFKKRNFTLIFGGKGK
jgi:hypothetical protein